MQNGSILRLLIGGIKMKCLDCFKAEYKLAHGGVDVMTIIGNNKIIDTSATVEVCPNCGAYIIDYLQLNLVELRSAKKVLSDDFISTGAELKFARKALEMRRPDFAKVINCTFSELIKLEDSKNQISSKIKSIVLDLVEAKLMDLKIEQHKNKRNKS